MQLGPGTYFPRPIFTTSAYEEWFHNGEAPDRRTAAEVPYSNSLELAAAHIDTPAMSASDHASTSLRPRFLCFLNESAIGYETRNVIEYLQEHGDRSDTEFMIFSYTRLQFQVATREELENYPYDNQQIRNANIEIASKDRETLVRWGIDAARAAGKKALMSLIFIVIASTQCHTLSTTWPDSLRL